VNLSGMTFRAVSNSKNGSLNTETEMRFTSDDGVVVGNYNGGTIVAGHVLGKHIGESEVEMLYQGATTGGDIEAGTAHATFALDEDDQMHMSLEWQWLTGDRSSGRSEWIRTETVVAAGS
jgi:hypothetical protein